MTEIAKWVRIWKGQTSAENFEPYTEYLYENGVKKILQLPNNLGVQLWRRLNPESADFTVTSFWPSLEAIKVWAGEDITRTRFLDKDPFFLLSLENSASVDHFEIHLPDPIKHA